MRSVAATSSIVATIITMLVVPVLKGGKVVGHETKRGTAHTIRCVPGKKIPATARAKRLGVAGKICKKRITRVVYVRRPVKQRSLRTG